MLFWSLFDPTFGALVSNHATDIDRVIISIEHWDIKSLDLELTVALDD